MNSATLDTLLNEWRILRGSIHAELHKKHADSVTRRVIIRTLKENLRSCERNMEVEMSKFAQPDPDEVIEDSDQECCL